MMLKIPNVPILKFRHILSMKTEIRRLFSHLFSLQFVQAFIFGNIDFLFCINIIRQLFIDKSLMTNQ